jgi:hypothetical protein
LHCSRVVQLDKPAAQALLMLPVLLRLGQR